jgi:hypothetical protein
LHAVASVPDKHLARLIADLDSKTFAVREKATRELENLSELAGSACRQALERQTSLEVRQRLEALLDRQAQQRLKPSPEVLRGLRALEVLELTGTKQARTTLSRLSQGAAAARLTMDAKETLARLDRAR